MGLTYINQRLEPALQYVDGKQSSNLIAEWSHSIQCGAHHKTPSEDELNIAVELVYDHASTCMASQTDDTL